MTVNAHPSYGTLRPVSPVCSVVLENNPSSMTLEGTNSWILRSPSARECVIVDPGHEDIEHLRVLAESAPVELTLLTHHHPDHADGAAWLAERVAAPVRAFDPALCLPAGGVDASTLVAGEQVAAAGLTIQVVHTPGHTDDSVSLRVDHESHTQVLTGDTVLGRGTTVLSNLGDYLGSLRTLAGLPAGTLGLPGHGPEILDLTATVRDYLEHREQRLDQVREALARLGNDATPRQIVEYVYADVDRTLWAPAEHSVRAQLEYLRSGA